jgi:hypothetical protein
VTVDAFEIILLSSRSGNGEAELEENAESAEGEYTSYDPEEKGYTN